MYFLLSWLMSLYSNYPCTVDINILFVFKDLISNMRHDMRWMKSLLVSTVWCAFSLLKCLKFLKKDVFSGSHLSYKRSRQFSSYEIYRRINYDTKESYVISFKIRYKKSEAKYTKEWIRRSFWVNLVVLWMQTFDVSHDCPRSL